MGYVNFCTKQKSYLLLTLSYYWMKYLFIHLDILSNTQSICSCDWLAHFLICSLWKKEKIQFRLGICKLLSTTVSVTSHRSTKNKAFSTEWNKIKIYEYLNVMSLRLNRIKQVWSTQGSVCKTSVKDENQRHFNSKFK